MGVMGVMGLMGIRRLISLLIVGAQPLATALRFGRLREGFCRGFCRGLKKVWGKFGDNGGIYYLCRRFPEDGSGELNNKTSETIKERWVSG